MKYHSTKNRIEMRVSAIILSKFLLVKNEAYSSVNIPERIRLFALDCFCCFTFSVSFLFHLMAYFTLNNTWKGTRNWTGPLGPNVLYRNDHTGLR